MVKDVTHIDMAQEPAVGWGIRPIHSCVGPGIDSPLPPFSRILILVVGLRMPIGNVICPKSIHDLIGNLSFGWIIEEFVHGSLPANVILNGVNKLLPTFHRVSVETTVGEWAFCVNQTMAITTAPEINKNYPTGWL